MGSMGHNYDNAFGRDHQRAVQGRTDSPTRTWRPKKRWSWSPSNGFHGSITRGCSNLSATFRHPWLRQTTTG